MNPKGNNENNRNQDRRRPGKSGFNIVFTLLIVVFLAMLMVTTFGENPMSGAIEISPIAFKKLLYSCRIVHLDVTLFEKVEGVYLADASSRGEEMHSYPDQVEGNANLGSFMLELSLKDLKELAPNYENYVGKRVLEGNPLALMQAVESGSILIDSFYTVTSETSTVRAAAKPGAQREPFIAGLHDDAGTELFVSFFDDQSQARFEYYDFKGTAGMNGGMGSLSAILSTLTEKFPEAEQNHHVIQGEDSLSFTRPNTFWTTIFAPLIPWILIVGLLWFFIIRQMRMGGGGGNVLSFGRSRATLVNKEKTTVTFADVAGIDEAKEEVTEIIEFLKNPGKFSRLGGRIPSGVLLVGSPGTGKTLLARAIAGEADVPFYSICGSDFVEMFVGVGASRVRDLFRQARENSPCLIFLDEIDAVGRKRGSGLGGGHDEREQTLNAILVEMDGFEKDEGIILVAATNRPDVLDPALLRPGRFDRDIVIDLPDVKGREEILKVHCRKIKISDVVDLNIIARGTPGFSGAELAAIVNEAALIATMKDRSAVAMADLEEARDKVRWGRQKKSRVMDEEDKLVTAYHEAGHALVSHLIPEAEQVHKVTIIPRGAALGATMILPVKDRYHHRRQELLANIKVLYAGRIAEEKFCNDISGGAKNDIERATEMARMMVCQLGMSDAIGPICYSEQNDHVFLGEELTRSQNHSDEVARLIDSEIKRILGESYDCARELIEANVEKMEALAQALMQIETLTGKEVISIIEGKSIDEIDFEHAIKPPPPTPVEPAKKQPEKEDERETDLGQGDLPAGEPAY